MKWSTFAFGAFSLLATASAQCTTVRFRIENSPNAELNGLYLQSYNNTATIGGDFTDIIAHFPDNDVRTETEILATGVPGDGNGYFVLIPVGTLGVEKLTFAEVAIPEAHYTDWSIINGFATSTLTYGSEPDKFMAFPSPTSGAPWEIYWVPGGATVDIAFDIDLVLVSACE